MRHANLAVAVSGVGALLLAIACSSAETDSFAGDSTPPSGGTSSGGSFTDAGAAPETKGGATATGVLLVHAAAFPSFRLCFESFPELPPQPDASIMPEANVVGVEIGSLVRVDPMQAPGRIYVFREAAVRPAQGETNPRRCGDLLTDDALTENADYYVTGNAITEPLGQNKVSVLAITGCGGQALLTKQGLSSDACGADYDVTGGNLKAKVVDLSAATNPTPGQGLPVQLFQMSQALDTFKGGSGSLSVSFGDLASDAGTVRQDVATGPAFEGGPQTVLSFDLNDEKLYGAWGFRVVANTTKASFGLDQSLAQVQELSSPRDVPTSYYRAASNYALLLLGDPTHEPTFADGGANPLYNARQSVHILAVPVIDPSKEDGGVDGGGS